MTEEAELKAEVDALELTTDEKILAANIVSMLDVAVLTGQDMLIGSYGYPGGPEYEVYVYVKETGRDGQTKPN